MASTADAVVDGESATHHPYVFQKRHSGIVLPLEAYAEAEDSSDGESGTTSHAGEQALAPEALDEGVVLDEADLVHSSARGLHYHAKIFTDDYNNPKHCTPTGDLKPRRPLPQIKMSELFSGLVQKDGRWIFAGPLNGWPGLTHLELVALTRRVKGFAGFGPSSIKRDWKSDSGAPLPKPSEIRKGTRATFKAPAWTDVGWADGSAGFVWWFLGQRPELPVAAPKCIYGESMVHVLRDDQFANAHASYVHALAHRYPVEKETLTDKQTWHAAILIEWDHGRFTTLFELAYLNGCGGFGGMSNWCEDKLAHPTELCGSMPDSFKSPWDTTKSEIRVVDLPMRSKQEVQDYLTKYSNSSGLPLKEQRFVDPEIYASAPVRLRSCTQVDLAGYMLNYMNRAKAYIRLRQNCQTFAADAFAFLTGTRDVKPFGAVSRVEYQQRSHSFMYLPNNPQ